MTSFSAGGGLEPDQGLAFVRQTAYTPRRVCYLSEQMAEAGPSSQETTMDASSQESQTEHLLYSDDQKRIILKYKNYYREMISYLEKLERGKPLLETNPVKRRPNLL